MQIKSLTLIALGLLFHTTYAKPSTPLNDVAIVQGEDGTAPSYLSVYDADNDAESDFELSEEVSHISKRAETCIKYHTVSGSDSCVSIAKKYDITLQNVYDWNPQIRKGCPNLNNGKKYCVKSSSKHSVSKLNVKAAKRRASKKTTKRTTKKTTKEVRKKIQTSSVFTYYWIAQPSDYSGGKSVAVKTCSGSTVGKVDEHYANALVMEGTGVIGSKIVNLGDCTCSDYKCFELVNKHTDPYGLTSYDSPLRPYITVASNDIKKNTKIYVPSLVGWTLPGTNKKHNGCLLVDDQSWSFKNRHIDFYVYTMSHYQTLDKAHKITHVDIYEGGSCKLINYNI